MCGMMRQPTLKNGGAKTQDGKMRDQMSGPKNSAAKIRRTVLAGLKTKDRGYCAGSVVHAIFMARCSFFF